MIGPFIWFDYNWWHVIFLLVTTKHACTSLATRSQVCILLVALISHAWYEHVGYMLRSFWKGRMSRNTGHSHSKLHTQERKEVGKNIFSCLEHKVPTDTLFCIMLDYFPTFPRHENDFSRPTFIDHDLLENTHTTPIDLPLPTSSINTKSSLHAKGLETLESKCKEFSNEFWAWIFL